MLNYLTDKAGREGRGGKSVLPDRTRKDSEIREDEEKGMEKKGGGEGWRPINRGRRALGLSPLHAVPALPTDPSTRSCK